MGQGQLTSASAALTLGISVKSLHRYEKHGLIPRAKRHPANGYRIWTSAELAIIARLLEPQEVPECPA